MMDTMTKLNPKSLKTVLRSVSPTSSSESVLEKTLLGEVQCQGGLSLNYPMIIYLM